MKKFNCDYCGEDRDMDEKSIYVFEGNEDMIACKVCEEKAMGDS